jgi:hypothetical protein
MSQLQTPSKQSSATQTVRDIGTALEGTREVPKSKPVIVLGVERSGTSVVTEMVNRWGAYAGAPHMLHAGDERNPQGFWEYKPLWEFMGELCGAAGISWWDAAFKPPTGENDCLQQYKEKALRLVAGMEREGEVWVWKYPDLTFFMPFWKEVWGDASYIITVRDPYESALSWQKFVMWQGPKHSMNFIAGNILRWQFRMLSILEQTDEAENRLFISYERLVQAPLDEAKRLNDFLNGVSGREESSVQNIEFMAQAIKPKFWRNRSEHSFDEVREATNEQKALHRFLQSRSQDLQEKFEPEKWTIYAGALDLAKNQELFTEYYGLTDRLLKFLPVQALLAVLKPLDFLIYVTEMERYVKDCSRSKRFLKTTARLFMNVSRARCYLRRLYKRGTRFRAKAQSTPA